MAASQERGKRTGNSPSAFAIINLMRAFITLFVGLAAIVLGNYWFNPYIPMCRLPVEYSIGDFDERFGVTEAEALEALVAAEAVWETALGREDVFEYQDEGPFQVNFIYDERQRQAEAALEAKEDLMVRGDANEVLTELHGRLVSEYETYKAEYDAKLSSYERELAAYNADVERYNDEGGAPPQEYRDLERRRAQLDGKQNELHELFEKLEDLADQINSIGDKGNDLIGEYNELVEDFNHTFAHGHEYTQGDYRGREINIYTFTDKEELVLVLAHELGHALSLGHVDSPNSIMYYLMDEQPRPPELSDEDKEAFNDLCGGNFPRRLLASLQGVYNNLVNN